MNILFTRFPLESAHGGAENQTRWLMQGLRERGHHVSFLGSCPVLLEYCREDDIPAVELDIGPPPVTKGYAFSFLWRQCKMKRRLKAVLQSYADLDAVCMLSLSEKILLTDTVNKSGANAVWIEHDSVNRWLTMNPYLAQIKHLSKQVKTVVVSELSRTIYKEIGWPEDELIAIPNGMQTPKETVERRGSNDGRLHVGCIARLSEEKGVDLLIEAAMEVPEVDLTIVGEGDELDAYQVLAEQLNVHDRVTFAGRLPSLTPFYEEIDVLALPSREHDPFGLVVAEAMLHGIPTLLTDACGIAGYLEHEKDALIVPSNDALALAEGLKQLLDVPLRDRLALQGQTTAQEKFTVEGMVGAYEEVLGK